MTFGEKVNTATITAFSLHIYMHLITYCVIILQPIRIYELVLIF